MRDALVQRLPRLASVTAAVAAGCDEPGFAPLAWWWAPIPALALLAGCCVGAVDHGAAGGFGYGLLFGLAFYPRCCRGSAGSSAAAAMAGAVRDVALFPALFAGGWRWWFAGCPVGPSGSALLWVAQEWLKSSVPFGGFPARIPGFSPGQWSVAASGAVGRSATAVVGVALLGLRPDRVGPESVRWWRLDPIGTHPPAVVGPGVVIAVVLLSAALAHPQVHRSGAGAGNEPR